MNPPILAPKKPGRQTGWFRAFSALVLALGLLAATAATTGCQTNRIDWNARVGNYTFDEAVKEMGPPDKTATLTDGTQVCEWVTQRGHDSSTVITSGYYGTYSAISPGSPEVVIRLTFNPQKTLTEAKRLYK